MRLIIDWILFCFIPFGFVILIKMLDQTQNGKFEWELFLIFGIIWVIAIINTYNIIKKNEKF
jgi:uncharacterized membrane protein